MNKNHEKAEQIVLKYLKKNRKKISLDDDAKKILREDSDSFEYFEYEISEINTELRKAGLSLEKLPENILKLTNPLRNANYLSGSDMISIKRKTLNEFIMCEFIHEFAHRKFFLKEWDKTNFKKNPSNINDLDPEEYTCKILGWKYAEKKGYGKKYGEYIGLFNTPSK